MRLKNRFLEANIKLPPTGVNETYVFIFYENLNYTYEVNYVKAYEDKLPNLLLNLLFIGNAFSKKKENNVYCRKMLYCENRYFKDYIIVSDTYENAKNIVKKYIDTAPITYYRSKEQWKPTIF